MQANPAALSALIGALLIVRRRKRKVIRVSQELCSCREAADPLAGPRRGVGGAGGPSPPRRGPASLTKRPPTPGLPAALPGPARRYNAAVAPRTAPAAPGHLPAVNFVGLPGSPAPGRYLRPGMGERGPPVPASSRTSWGSAGAGTPLPW